MPAKAFGTGGISRRGALALPVLLLAARQARAQEIEILSLRYRTADQILPLLQPLVEPGGALTGEGSQLFLRASRANAQHIKHVLATLDRAPRQLVITVRQSRDSEDSSRQVNADGSVTISNRQVQGSVGVDARGARTTSTRSAEQSIRVLEGGRAYITMGAAVPFTFQQWRPQPGGSWMVTDNTVFYEALTGFYVQPQVAGNAVTLDIAPEDAAIVGGTLDRARLATRVQTRLGEWTAVGGADASSATAQIGVQTGVVSGGREVQASQRGVWVKVDEAALSR